MTTQQRINCIKLMLSVPRKIKNIKFNMSQFFEDIRNYLISVREIKAILKKDKNLCGTTCCFLGHGAVAGIGDVNIEGGYFCSWESYSLNSYGIREETKDWKFLFRTAWPNNRSQAAARMQYFLLGGDISSYRFDDEYEAVDVPYWRAELKDLKEKLKKEELCLN